MVPMTSVSWIDRSSCGESTMTARCTTVSMRRRRTSLPMTESRVSAWTKSISSSALTGSDTSQPNMKGTWGASRRATSEPSGLDTPVISTRRGWKGVTDPRLWIDSPDCRCVRHALYRQRVSREAHVDALVDRGVEDLVERPRDHMVQLGVDLLFLPEEGLQVLHPFEVGHDHAAGVGDDVGHDEDPSLVQDRVRLRGDRGVGTFGDEAGANPGRVLLGDLVLHRGGHEHGDRQLEQLR